MTIIYS